MVRERTRAGLKVARKQGRKAGPTPQAYGAAMGRPILAADRAGAEIAGIFRVNRATISHIAAAARAIPAKAELVT
jgi:DNA invertase Pin-like site-specific DNA recombinase